jgi:hypothetical protein
MRRAAFIGIVLALAAGASACGSRETPAAEEKPAAAASPAPAPPSVPLIAPDRLRTFLPPATDWQQSDVKSAGIQLPAPGTHATAVYTRQNARAELAITDTGGRQEFLEATLTVAGTDFLQKAANGYQKGARVAGHPAIESWNHQDRLGEFTIVVNSRFLIYVTATGLDSIQTLRGLVDQIPFKDIESLTVK